MENQVYKTITKNGVTVKYLDFSDPKVQQAARCGAEAFFASDPDNDIIPGNPYEWGTVEFQAWADQFEVERGVWLDQQEGQHHG